MTRVSHPTGSQSRSQESNSNIARDGAPKKHTDHDFEPNPHGVPIHPGMTSSQKSMAGVGGQGGPVVDGGTRLTDAYQTDVLKQKNHGQVPAHPRMRSSTEYQHAHDAGSHVVAHQGTEAGDVLRASILSGSTPLPKAKKNG